MNSEEKHAVLLSYTIIAFFVSIGFLWFDSGLLFFVGISTGLMLGIGFGPALVHYSASLLIDGEVISAETSGNLTVEQGQVK